MTYGELDARARRIGVALAEVALAGERAVLLYPPGLEYIAGFFGCLYAGVVAVPAYPPDPARLERTLPRLRAIIGDSRATVVLTTTFIRGMVDFLAEQAPDLAKLRWMATDELAQGLEDAWRRPAVDGGTLAFLQYTSGSTGVPKGVMLSHSNLMNNLWHANQKMEIHDDSRCVFWLPPYHDMGLIGGILEQLYAGNQGTVLMSPYAFLKRPLRWLEAISRFQATLSGAPNFAFDLCVRKSTPEQRAGLQLGTWEVAFSGAEPIRAETLERFVEAFGVSGFRREALYPCYGLAEGTLIAAGGLKAEPPILLPVEVEALEKGRAVEARTDAPGTRVLVSSGRTLCDQELVIVELESGRPCPDGTIGEIWLKSPSVAQGYWNRPEETERTFQARLADSDAGPFLRTGDLGFVRDGELFVAARLKDLIILHGRNHYPQDLESTVELSHPALRPGCNAAFAIDEGGEERLVVVQEVDTRRPFEVDAVVAAVRAALAQQHSVQLYALALIPPGGIQKTTSGKIQRRATRAAFLEQTLETVHLWRASPGEAAPVPRVPVSATPAPAEPPATEPRPHPEGTRALVAWLTQALAEALGMSVADVDPRTPFSQYGVDSVVGVRLAGDLEARLGRPMPATLVWEHPTIEALARHLSPGDEAGAEARVARATSEAEPIAIIGLGCRFPQADGVEAFWRLLSEGVDAIREVPADRWDIDAYFDAEPTAPGKMTTRWGGFLDSVDGFDREFFGISPREAARMDPQQRLMLEVAWEALEDAGLPAERLAGTRAGVFVGISTSDYGSQQLTRRGMSDAYAGTGSALSIAANRLSYLLDLRGPSLAIDTACSSSLVAVHMACQSLRSGESEVALAGGVNVVLSPALTVNFSKAGFMAPDGRCKPFDASANGYVRSEGAGVVVLKPLSRALADGDTIHAVIRGSAVNQDGRSNGLTAPNRLSQEAVLREAYRRAGVSPGRVRYVEAHGTGTALGDPIEARALGAVLAEGRAPGDTCAIGSVKSNLGHLEAAAGIAGLLKVVLSLRERALPPTLHFRAPNPHIPFAELPLRVQQHLEPLPETGEPTLAGVSAFGFGGTNAHVVLESFRPSEDTRKSDGSRVRPQLLPLSARSPAALRALAQRYLARVTRDGPDAEARLESLCDSAGRRRGTLEHRLALTVSSAEELREKLEAFVAGERRPGTQAGLSKPGARPKLAFVFSGQGPQWPRMARELMRHAPVLREMVERCDALLRPLAGWSLLEELDKEGGASRLAETAFAQPVLFALQVGLSALWRSLGVEPDTVVGHSAGEVAAAHVAGLLSLPDAIRVIHQRGLAAQRASGLGRMALVELGAVESSRLLVGLEERVAIAALNGPTSTVLSGDAATLTRLVASLEQRGIYARMLGVDYASHSPQMDAFCPELERSLTGLAVTPPTLPILSTVDALPVTTAAYDAAYWARQLRAPVQFARTVERMLDEGHTLFVEMAPHPLLLADLGQRLRERGLEGAALPSMRRREDERTVFLESVGALFAQGVDVRWGALQPARPPVPLPTYPWQRERCWLPGLDKDQGTGEDVADEGLEDTESLGDWLYGVQWEPLAPPDATVAPGAPWLLLADAGGTAEALAERLQARGEQVELLPRGETGTVAVREAVAERLQARGLTGLRVVHLWGLDAEVPAEGSVAELRAALALGCAPAVGAIQALTRAPRAGSRLWVVTRGAQSTGGASHPVATAQAPLWGLGRTIASEHPDQWGGAIDLSPATEARQQVEALLRALAAEGEEQVALRDGQLLVARLVRRREWSRHASLPRLRPDATYLITGGLGGLGSRVARWLIRQGARRLLLLSRTRLPPRAQWRRLEEGTPMAGHVRTLRELEALGASIHVASMDVADEAALRAFLEAFREEGWPDIRGVVHAAGVLHDEDRKLSSIDEKDLESILRPKAEGGWLLHQLLRDAPLDFFVGFSSVAALFGSPVQAAYSAANAFLDALAHERRARGLPALSINWAPWAGPGMGVRPDQEGRLAGLGFQPMAPERALAALGLLIGSNQAQAGVMSVRWDVLRQLMGTAREPRFLAHLRDTEASSSRGTTTGGALREQLRSLGDAERRARLAEFLRAEAAAVIGLTPSRLEMDRPLNTMGFDSIMAIELRNRIVARLGVQLPIVEFVKGPTLNELATTLAEQLSLEGATPTARVEIPLVRHQPTSPDAPINLHPLAYSQERMWFIQQIEPESVAHNVPLVLRLRTVLDIEALRRVFDELMRRHEPLRTSFRQQDGVPQQVVEESWTVELPHQDLRSLPEAEREAQALARAMELARRPFDLSQGPLLRLALYQLAGDEHLLVMVMHHIVTDGWSLEVMARELVELYEAFSRGQPSPLAPLPVRYADFARWQRDSLQGEELHSLLTWWKQQLGDAPPVLELPGDRPRPAVRNNQGARHPIRVPRPLAERLKQLSHQSGVTLYMTLLAGFQTLLHRYSGQEDICVGSPTAGRTRSELEGLVGFFLNTLVMRGRVSPHLTVRQLLAQVREVALGAYAHQDAPFDKLVEVLQPVRSFSYTPLFQVLFIFHKSHLGANLSGPLSSVVDLHTGSATYDLTLQLTEDDEGLGGTLEYSTELFDETTIARMVRHLLRLWEAMTEGEEQRLGDLSFLTPEERHTLLVQWNDTARSDFPQHLCPYQLFESHARLSPDSIAVSFLHRSLSYGQLNRLANRAARLLRSLSVGPDVLVPLLSERNPELLASMLAVSKAGGAFLPLDPLLPPQRLAAVLSQSRSSLVLVSSELLPSLQLALDSLPPSSRPRFLLINDVLSSSLPDSDLEPLSSPSNLAYVIFTSGSTGVPKGAMVEHRGMLNHLFAKNRDLGCSSSDVIAQTASQNFDIFVYQNLTALLLGARTHIVSNDDALSPDRLLSQVRSHRVSILNIVPSQLRSLVDALTHRPSSRDALSSLRWMVPTGEALPPELCREWLALMPSIPLLNAYGHTECSDDQAHFPLLSPPSSSSTPIGRPIQNLRFYVLDERLNPLPLGATGELFIGGLGVGRGYLGDPSKTAEKFLPDPFSPLPGARLYKTGDLGRWNASGLLEMLGRVDFMVKLRGFRLELGEVETALSRFPSVRDAVAVVRTDSGLQRLVAYVVPRAGHSLSSSDLRSFLKDSLPEHMVPSLFVLLDSLPLTPNGKVDRKALPPPTASSSADAYLPPLGPIEESVASILSSVLKLPRVSRSDSFFDLGGHSLLATQALSRINLEFGVELPLRQLFENPSVAGISALVTQHQLAGVQEDQLEHLIATMEELSDEEVQALLDADTLTNDKKPSANE
ncbi:amino acid adenylation domain-containing protein [Myxococcus stipitatus]|uniref:amino acid adenylation domain-containing protein n=1 Tax=Myxococcus stipitatus TaxID=83455 RepID=UPI003AF2C685